jgi:5-methylthioadenosine/S-adenosylhomocysteine deaminase
MLASGVTSFNDMYFFPEVVADILEATGLRGCVSGPILEFPTAWGANAAEYLVKNTEVVQHYKNHPRISAGYGPHAPYTVSNNTWEKTIQLAHDNNTWVHTHLHETAFEVEQSVQEHGMRPVARLDKLGFFDVHSQAVHMTQLNEEDIANIRGKKCHIIHCPESNLKLASGFTPLNAIIEAGINFNIGTDGAASNNDLDMVSELRTAAILAKAVASDAAALPAYTALYGATRGGALAFGQEKLGCLAKGFAADIIAVNLSDLNTQPVYDPIAQFVYAANSRQVSHVWVDGKLVYEHGQVRVIDTDKLKTNIHTWRQKLLSA